MIIPDYFIVGFVAGFITCVVVYKFALHYISLRKKFKERK